MLVGVRPERRTHRRVARGPHHAGDCLDVGGTDEQVEVRKRAQRRVLVREPGERRALQQDRVDAGVRQLPQERLELRVRRGGALGALAAEPLECRRHGFRRRARRTRGTQPVADQRRHTLAERQAQDRVPLYRRRRARRVSRSEDREQIAFGPLERRAGSHALKAPERRISWRANRHASTATGKSPTAKASRAARSPASAAGPAPWIAAIRSARRPCVSGRYSAARLSAGGSTDVGYNTPTSSTET